MTATITLARHDDLDAAADTLAEAFEQYPWTRWVVPERGYSERLRQLQRIYLKHAHQHGFVGADADLSGVVAVLPPDAPDPGEEIIAQIVALHGERIERISTSTLAPDPDAWSLETLGVRPDAQGHGLGGELVRFALLEAGRRGARTIRLETSDERNVRLYERCGFRVTRHLEQEHAPMLWSLEARLTTGTAADALHEYLMATNSHDFENVARVLTKDPSYFFGDSERRGLPDVREYFERAWDAVPDERYWAEDVEWVAVTEGAATATYTYRWVGTRSGSPVSGSGHATNAFVRTGIGWRLAHEHLSTTPE